MLLSWPSLAEMDRDVSSKYWVGFERREKKVEREDPLKLSLLLPTPVSSPFVLFFLLE